MTEMEIGALESEEAIEAAKASVAEMWEQATPYLPMLPFTERGEGGSVSTTLPALIVAMRTIEPEGSKPTPEAIIEAVAGYFDLQIAELESKSRVHRFLVARQAAMYLIRKHTSLSLITIGDLFDRDHSTALHAIKKAEELLAIDPEFHRHVHNIVIPMSLEAEHKAVTLVEADLYELPVTSVDPEVAKALNWELEASLDWSKRSQDSTPFWAAFGKTAEMQLKRLISHSSPRATRKIGKTAMLKTKV